MNLNAVTTILPTPDDDAAWYDVITKFKNYAAKFASQYNELKSINIDPSRYPELADEQTDLLKRGLSIQQTIRDITSAVDDTWTWLKSKFGFNGFSDVSQLSSTLGFAPLIPIAVVAGSVALIAKWVFDYLQFLDKLSEMKRLESKGYSSIQASEIINKVFGESGILSDLNKALPYLLIGGVGLFLYLNRDKL